MPVQDTMCRDLIDPRWVGQRIAVAMSGGVDSSVAAVLLAKGGCDVVGITMKLWDYTAVGGDNARDGRCCTVESFANCRAVADQYGFPHYAIDLTGRFEHDVIGYFVSEYRSGRTPNPCAVCNTKIKWPALWEKAAGFGCEAIATGHYAKLSAGAGGAIDLRRALDPSRDQTYFLWGVPRDYLARTLFPLGGFLKNTVREIAGELRLPNAETPESRDICFVSDGDLGRFMRERGVRDGIVPTSGAVVNLEGEPVARHAGYDFLTIGQRNGLGIALGRPQYVTGIDPVTGTVRIGDDAELYKRRCEVQSVNWFVEPSAHLFRALVQVRYRHRAAPAQIVTEGGCLSVLFDDAQRAITPGQSAVFYDGDRVLGGGTIGTVGPD